MAEFKVTSSQLISKANELKQLNNQFKTAVSDMTSTESSLMGMWDGDSKEAFHKAYTSDKNQMDVFYQTIEKYCEALERNIESKSRKAEINSSKFFINSRKSSEFD